jgi:hypothetical protein
VKVHLPWTDRNPAEWAEDDIPTQGGLYGWDHSICTEQPIPGSRRQEWMRRRRTYEENAAAHPTLFDLIND